MEAFGENCGNGRRAITRNAIHAQANLSSAGEGLFRFDGISFERIVPEGKAAEDDYPTAVFVSASELVCVTT